MDKIQTRRDLYRKGLHPLYLPYYDALCGLLPDYFQPISGLRTIEQQDKLYALGRTSPGRIVTKAKGGLSFHNYGLASDWDHFDGKQYQPLEFDDALWVEYEQACEKVGLRTLEWEKPHNEYPTTWSIKTIFSEYEKGGMDAVTTLLKT